MIKYHIQNKIVTMDMVDLEHCGFDHESFTAELQMAGITKLGAKWPVVLMVNFAGGGVITEQTETRALEHVVSSRKRFDEMVSKLMGEEKN